MSRYIDADALKEWLDEYLSVFKKYDKGTIKGFVDHAPSIDIVRGEWELVEPRYPIEQKVYWSKEQALADIKGNGAIEKRKCSCCGFTKNYMGHMKDEKFNLWNYCPNCGAKMDREREGE